MAADQASVGSVLGGWWQSNFLGIQAWQIGGLLLVVLLGYVARKVTMLLVSRPVSRLVGRWLPTEQQEAPRRLSLPIGNFVLIGVLAIGLPVLRLPEGVMRPTNIALRAFAMLAAIWLGFIIADLVALWLAGRASKTESKLDDQLVPLFRKSLKLVMAVLGSVFLLQNLNVDVGSLLAGLGLGGLAFALAAKDTVANLFGSVMIFIDKPFQVGDWVKIGSDLEGTVEEVGFRTTRVRTFYDSLITVPNARIVDTAVDNLGIRRYRRYSTILGLTYDTPPERVEAFCAGVRELLLRLDGVRRDYFIVELQDFTPHSLGILLYCFFEAPTWTEELRFRSNLNLEILRLAARLGVSFALPARTIHFAEPTPPLDALRAAGRSTSAAEAGTTAPSWAASTDGRSSGPPRPPLGDSRRSEGNGRGIRLLRTPPRSRWSSRRAGTSSDRRGRGWQAPPPLRPEHASTRSPGGNPAGRFLPP